MRRSLSGNKASKFIKPDQAVIQKLINEEKDDRYRYLLRQGVVYGVDLET